MLQSSVVVPDIVSVYVADVFVVLWGEENYVFQIDAAPAVQWM